MTTMQRLTGQLPALIALFLVSLALEGCASKKNEQADPNARYVVPVEAAAAVRKHLSVSKIYSGPIEGEEQANIVSKLSERITAIHFHVGESVASGQVVIGLDKSGVTSQYFQAEAGFKNADATLKRMKSLYGEGAISLQTLDASQMGYDVARANFEAAKNAVELTTPIAGIVTAVNVNVGDLAIPGSLLATVARIDRMKIIFSMNETDIPNIEMNQKVSVFTEANPSARTEGKIVQLSKSADSRSRSFEIRAAFPNRADRWFKPGMFGKVSLEISSKTDPIVIPNAAIQSDESGNRVFVVRGGKSTARAVELGISDGENTAVLSGIAVGDTVATVGANNLKDNSDVKVVPH